jgi:hypothetical protein
MITKELIKAEIEKVQSDYLEVLYKIIKIFATPPKTGNGKIATRLAEKDDKFDWHAFIAQTYGCLADAPIERGDQGVYEIREAMS